MTIRRLVPLTLLAALALTPAAHAAEAPEGATWTQATITSGDGTLLHADILRPENLPDTAKTPVILSVGPYFNHSGEVGALAPAEGAQYDPSGPVEGPSSRFYDFVEGARLMERGYTFVMVDLRSFGGSGGCLDWMGPGEQGDVKAAVEWAASQPWSNGHVGMYGKSYDAVTGLVGEILNPEGLDAVVAQEPVYDLYRYLYSDGVRFANSAGTPALYNAIAATPGPLADEPSYNLNGATPPDCLAANYAAQQDPDHESAYWKQRDLIAGAANGRVPLFMMQGFLENNTKPDGAFDFFNAVQAPKRAWFGMWDHVRGNDVDAEGRLKAGRPGFFDETMRFLDHYVRDVPLADAATDKDPPVAVQSSDGTWRSEAAWPPADSELLRTTLKPGTYTDDGNNNGTGAGAGHGLWTISPPLVADAWYAGVPKATLDLGATASMSNVVVDTYDIAPDRQAILLSRNAQLVPEDGQVAMDLYGNDWRIPAGHRLGVLVTGSNAEWWLHAPTNAPVELKSGTVDLPFLRHERPKTITGGSALRLEQWLEDAPFEVPKPTITAQTVGDFALPAALTPAPVTTPTPTPAPVAGRTKRLRVRIVRKGFRLFVYGDAPARARLTVRLLRSNGVFGRTRVVRVRRLRTKVNAFRLTFRVVRFGSYRATVVAERKATTLRARSKRVRVR